MQTVNHSNRQHYKNTVPPLTIKLLIITEAAPLPEENYFYNLSNNDHVHGAARSFFRGIMQGMRLLPIGVSVYSERVLLDAFKREGYFIIDSCPVPLVDEAGVQLPSSKKRKIMVNYIYCNLDRITRYGEENYASKHLFNQVIFFMHTSRWRNFKYYIN